MPKTVIHGLSAWVGETNPDHQMLERHFGLAPVVGYRLDGPRRQHLNLELPRGGRRVGHAGGRRRRDRQSLRAVVPRQLRPRAFVLEVILTVAVVLIRRELAVGAAVNLERRDRKSTRLNSSHLGISV